MPRPTALSLAALAICLGASPVRANDSAMGGHGGSLVPLRETRVQMVSEDIELRYAAGEWAVRAHYVFRNTADARVALQMGFPETHCDGEGDCVMGEGDVFQDMRTLVRGKEVQRKKGRLSEKHEWAPKLGMVWLYDVVFAPNEELEIDHTYTTPSGTDVMGTHFTTYVTRTGALWGKPIERATFRVVLPASTRQLYEPSEVPRVRTERADGSDALVLTYEARTWTPSGDFHIGFHRRVDWYALKPTGPLAHLRCDGLTSLYLLAEIDDGRAPGLDDLPEDAPSLRICRNAVYAQYGRRFRDEPLNLYFYGPQGFAPDGPALLAFEPNPDFDEALLTPVDREVLAMIAARERDVLGEEAEPPAEPDAPAEVAAPSAPIAPPPTEPVKTAPVEQTSSPAVAGARVKGVGSETGGCGGCSVGAVASSAGWLPCMWLWLRRRARNRGE